MADQQELMYEGFTGSIEASVEDECLHGRIQFIDDLITYEGNTISEIKSAFKDAVVRYLEHCKKIGKSPNKPYSGTFNVRIGAELHKQAAQKAASMGLSLNQLVTNAIQTEVVYSSPANRMSENQSSNVLMPLANNIKPVQNPIPSAFTFNELVGNYIQ